MQMTKTPVAFMFMFMFSACNRVGKRTFKYSFIVCSKDGHREKPKKNSNHFSIEVL